MRHVRGSVAGFVIVLIAVVTCLVAPINAWSQQFRIKAGHVSGTDFVYQSGFEYFGREIAKATDGRVKVDIFPASQLGDELQMIEGARLGTIQMLVTSTAPLSQFVPECDLLNLPFLFEGYQTGYKVMDGPVGAEFAQLIEAKTGLKFLGWWSAGMRNVYSKKAPVQSIADLANLKIRVMESKTEIATFKAFGAAPTPMPFSEVYTSLQTGVIDAAENDPISYLAVKHYEVAPYYSLTGHTNATYNRAVLMSGQFFTRLPKDVQDAVVRVMKDTVAFERAEYERRADDALKTLEQRGVKVVKVDQGQLRARAKGVWDETVQRLGPKGKELLDKILAASR